MEYFRTLYTTAAELLLAEGNETESKLLYPSNIQESIISHDNWNGGIDTYDIQIHLDPTEYAEVKKEKDIIKVEEVITEAIRESVRGDESVVINSVHLTPKSGAYSVQSLPVVNIDQSMWKTGYYRMFISHKVEYKESASNLKTALSQYGISGFVAHEDITPNNKWLQTIKDALRTTHSLCAIVTPNFIESPWCDQEVGIALGREIICIPIRKGNEPYGFLGEFQGIQSKGKDSKQIAQEIFKVLCLNRQSGYFDILSELFLNSNSEANALNWIRLLSSIRNITKEQVRSIRDRYGDNPTLQNDNVLQIANELFEKYGIQTIIKLNNTKATDDIDLPF